MWIFMGSPFALELKGITKTFGSTIANKDVDLQVKTVKYYLYSEKTAPVRQHL